MLQQVLSREWVRRAARDGLSFDAFVDYDAELRETYRANREAGALTEARATDSQPRPPRSFTVPLERGLARYAVETWESP